jgi:hypothetical protein
MRWSEIPAMAGLSLVASKKYDTAREEIDLPAYVLTDWLKMQVLARRRSRRQSDDLSRRDLACPGKSAKA